MRSRVTKALKPLDGIAVENPVRPGTPDVNYVEGWIELKWLRTWPVNADTVVQVKHFTSQQRVFHLRRRQAGGRSFVLLQCRREWILLLGEVAALNLGHCTREELHELAYKKWTDGLVQKELVECVSKPMKRYTLTEGDKAKLRLLLQRDTASASEQS